MHSPTFSNQQDCCDRCQFRPATFICHPATATCGVTGMCTGKSAKCPTNKKDCSKHHSSVSNTTGTDAMCGSHPCSARDLQCQAQATAQYNFTASCASDTSTCQVTCADPSGSLGGPTSCLALSLNFSDGTECGTGGTCANGVCIGGMLCPLFNNTRSGSHPKSESALLTSISIFNCRFQQRLILEKELYSAGHFRCRRVCPTPRLLPQHMLPASTKTDSR